MSDSRLCADCGKPTISENDVWCHDCGRKHWYGGDEPDDVIDPDPIASADTCCGKCRFGTCYVDQTTGA